MVGQFVACSTQGGMTCIFPVLGSVDHLSWVFDPKSDSKSFFFHRDLMIGKHPERIAGTVSDPEKYRIRLDQSLPALVFCNDPAQSGLIFGKDKIGHSGLKQNFRAVCDHFFAKCLNDFLETISADMRFGVIQNRFRCASFDHFFENKPSAVRRIFDQRIHFPV